jgi:peptide/nickel transport system substrate-binding protein
VARAKKLLPDAGTGQRLRVRDGHQSTTRRGAVGEIIQGMAREAGLQHHAPSVRVRLRAQGQRRRQAPAFLIGWSGRVDPDGNIHQGQACGGSLNATGACDEKLDAL